jgi:heme-degrading monooxygenase HmoA
MHGWCGVPLEIRYLKNQEVIEMALSILSWDLPPADKIETYVKKAGTSWIPTILKQPGVKEFRAYRNPYHTSPQVVVHTEFDSMASWLKYVESEDYASFVADMKAVGCTNLSVEVWDASPVVPEPLKPPSG